MLVLRLLSEYFFELLHCDQSAMSDRKIRKMGKGGVVVSQEYYDSLPGDQQKSGRYIVSDYSPFGAIAGATLLAQKSGFKVSCITPFVYEYLEHEKRRRKSDV